MNSAVMADTFVPTVIISVATTTETYSTTKTTTTSTVTTTNSAVITEPSSETGIGRGHWQLG